MSQQDAQPKKRTVRVILAAAIAAGCIALASSAGLLANLFSIVDGLCQRAVIREKVPSLCPGRIEARLFCTRPKDENHDQPCLSFYMTNPAPGFDLMGGEFEVLDISVAEAGNPHSFNSRQATYNARITNSHLAVGQRIPFRFDVPPEGNGENVVLQVCPYFTDPGKEITLTLRPFLYSRPGRYASAGIDSVRAKLRLTGIANPAAAIVASNAVAELVAPPATVSTLTAHGCETYGG